MDMGRPLVDRAKLTGLLIEEFIRSRRYVPDEASPIWALDDLPLKLGRRVQQLNGSWQWKAWAGVQRLWCVAAQILNEPRLDHSEHALRVKFFDVDGALVACADWLRRADGRWVLYRILEPAHLQSSQPERTEAI